MAQRFDTSYLTDSKPDVALQSPLETAGKVAQYRNLLLQGQVHQQQIANEQETLKRTQLANQETARKNQSMAAFEQSFHAAGGDPKKTRELALQNGVDSDTLQKFDEGTAKLTEAAAKADQEKANLAKVHTELTYQTLAPIAADPDPVSQSARWEAGQQALVKAGVKTPEEVTPYAGPSQVQGELAKTTYYAHVLEAAKEQRAQEEEKRKAEKAPVELAKEQAQATTAQLEAAGQKPLQPKDVAELNIQRARNLQTAQNEAEMRRQGAGHLAVAQAGQAIRQKEYEQQFGEGANPALQGVEKNMRVPAAKEAAKAVTEHEKALAAARDMKTFIDLARQGNVEANAYISPEGVMTLNTARGVSRVNMAEIHAYGSAGSFVQRLQGLAGKTFTGKSMPDSVLKDIEGLQGEVAKNADETFSRKIDENVDKVYHSHYGDVLKPKAAAGGGKINVISPEGVPGTIDGDKWDAAQKRGFKRQ